MERCQGYSESRSISLAGVPRSVLRFQHWEQAVEVEVLAPEPDHVHGLYEAARAAREAYLRGCPIGRIVEVVGEVAQRWQDPSDPCRRLAERLLPVTTGFSPPMVSLLLTQVFQRYTPDRLWALLREEVHDPLVLDEFRPRPHFSGQSRAYGPGVITHVLGGSNPALPAVSFIFALLCKSASVAKAPSEEPLFPALFIR